MKMMDLLASTCLAAAGATLVFIGAYNLGAAHAHKVPSGHGVLFAKAVYK